MAGRGRPPKARGIANVRELTAEDVAALDRGERGKVPVVARFRDSHHKVARLVASGMRLQDVAIACGYTMARVYTLNCDPSFKELVDHYRYHEDESYEQQRDHYNELLFANMLIAERRANDILQDDDREFSLRELTNVSRDAADRLGYGKKTVNFNINADFASAMEKAAQRSSKVIEGTAMVSPMVVAPQRTEGVAIVVPSPIRRRA